MPSATGKSRCPDTVTTRLSSKLETRPMTAKIVGKRMTADQDEFGRQKKEDTASGVPRGATDTNETDRNSRNGSQGNEHALVIRFDHWKSKRAVAARRPVARVLPNDGQSRRPCTCDGLPLAPIRSKR